MPYLHLPRGVPALLAVLATLSMGAAFENAARAALSEEKGTGVWEVQSAESNRPARLELGIFGSYRRLGLRDMNDTQLNALRGGVNAAFGMPGGFEISGTLPVFGHYTTEGSGGSPLDESVHTRLGDVSGRLRWNGPWLLPGMRWGLEGEVLFPTGDDHEVVYPGRGALKPYTAGQAGYTGRAMLTWDGLRAGTGTPIRLHANAAYTLQGDESRYLLGHAPLPLELPEPARNRDNDYMTIGAAVEFDLPRFTLFAEAVTDQFVYQRELLKGKENRTSLTPGIRFWLPGGVSIAGAYSMDLSEDDHDTAFDPGRAFPDPEWRIAVSLGTVYRGARARAEDAARAVPRPQAAVTVAPAAPESSPTAVETAAAMPSPADSVVAETKAKEQAILERREIQEEPKAPAPKAMPAPAEQAAPAVPVRPAPGMAAPAPPAGTVPGPVAPPAVTGRPGDSDGDGIADDRDGCPLAAEDWDGFQDFDGCPDVDNDLDGIPDIRDQCPNDRETYNGYYDFDGCPDEIPVRWRGPTSYGAPEVGAAPPAANSLRAGPGSRGLEQIGPPIAQPPVAEAPPAARASVAAADSLRQALERERRRAGELEARLAQTAAPRPVTPSPAAPGARASEPPIGSGAGAAPAPPAERQQLDELSQRLKTLEEQQRLSAGAADRTRAAAPQTGTTVIAPTQSAPRDDLAARMQALEAEVRSLRDQRPPSPGAPQAREPSAGSGGSAAQGQAEGSREILDRLDRIQSSFADLKASLPDSAAPAEAPTGDIAGALDLLLPPGRSRVFPQIQFKAGSAALRSDALRTIGSLANILAEVPEARVRVVGHTDDVGANRSNLRLSRERARAVADALIERGVGQDQLMVEGRGEEEPIASNRTSAGRQMNRRVEFIRVQQ